MHKEKSRTNPRERKYQLCFIVFGIWLLFTGIDFLSYRHYNYNMAPVRRDDNFRLHEMTEERPNKTYKIMWYEPPDWLHPSRSVYGFENCEYRNCEILLNKTDIRNIDLILFHHHDMNFDPPVKSSNHKWVFVSLESPDTTHRYFAQRRWKDKFDWTMSYRQDSEVYAPYGKLIPKTEGKSRNYTDVWNKKTNDVAWVVSNCGTRSRREKYVSEMKKVVNVDIFGNCGKPCNWTGMGCIKNLSKKYKFYLSLENSICEDYVTEKLFRIFNDGVDFVPIVRGAPNIKDLLPVGSYISSLDFNSPQSLAAYVKMVALNKTLYLKYLETKYNYVNVGNFYQLGMCSLCRKLNDKKSRKNFAINIKSWISKKPCSKPKDIVYKFWPLI